MNKAKKTKKAVADGEANGARAVPPSLVFSVRNLGNIQSGRFTHKPLTIFCGPNNSGKTWAMYSLYSFYSFSLNAYRHLSESNDGKSELSKLNFNKTVSANLHVNFNMPKDNFQDVDFSCGLPQKKWLGFLKSHSDMNVFLIPAARNGLHFLYHEISMRRTALLHKASKENVDLNDLLKDVMRSRYATPVADYIDLLNSMVLLPQESEEFHGEVLLLQKQLLEGRYKLNRTTGEVLFYPYRKSKEIPAKVLGIHSVSSTANSLLGLWFYLEHQAKRGDVLMIDEPELNLHPQSQLLITHMLARLVNQGIKVVISTHSDYIVREINNLIMLGENDAMLKTANRINKGKMSYEKDALLSGEQVGTYLVDNHMIAPFEYEKAVGFSSDDAFDDVIYRQNRTNVELYNGVME